LKISVITAVYNSEATVGEAIASVAAQTHPDVEHVNGGVKLGHGAAQNWATLGLRGTRVMSGGQSAALSM
jgi:hypothetical protein